MKNSVIRNAQKGAGSGNAAWTAIRFGIVLFFMVAMGFGGAFAQAGKLVTLKVGATPIPHGDLLQLIKPDLEAQGIKLEIVELTDYVTPNILLAEKQLDANFFQHLPYLNDFCADRKLQLESAGQVFVAPLGLYSRKYKKLEDIPAGSVITLPNDPTNEARALMLLEHKGLIKLDPKAGLKATIRDIVENPKRITFREIEAPQLPRTLDDARADHQRHLGHAGRLCAHTRQPRPRGRRVPLRKHRGGAQGGCGRSAHRGARKGPSDAEGEGLSDQYIQREFRAGFLGRVTRRYGEKARAWPAWYVLPAPPLPGAGAFLSLGPLRASIPSFQKLGELREMGVELPLENVPGEIEDVGARARNDRRIRGDDELAFPVCQKVVDAVFQLHLSVDSPLCEGFPEKACLPSARRHRRIEEKGDGIEIQGCQDIGGELCHALEAAVVRNASVRPADVP